MMSLKGCLPMRLSAAWMTLTVLASGCSTWRCRGFLDEREMPAEKWQGNYVIDSIRFPKVDLSRDEDGTTLWPTLAWLAHQDGLVGTSYISDIGKELGLTNDVPGVVRVNIVVLPLAEERSGKKTVFWPMCGTFGVFPAHLTEQVPFDAVVQFVSKDEFGQDSNYATASLGLVRTDYQCGLSRLDMDEPPDAPAAVGEVRDEGTIGTGRNVRPERTRDIFVKTLAAAVRKAIARRESLNCMTVPQAATEFGPVPFPAADVAGRASVDGWGANPVPKARTAETLEEFAQRAWSHPNTDVLKKLRRLVDMEMLTREDWKQQISELWATRKVSR